MSEVCQRVSATKPEQLKIRTATRSIATLVNWTNRNIMVVMIVLYGIDYVVACVDD